MTEQSTLQAGEDLAAKGATAPRISLDDMLAKVKGEHYFTAGAAIQGLHYETLAPDSPLHLLTICVLELENGWTLIGKSAPASADNFDSEKGQQFAKEDALKQLWPLEGYLLRERLHEEAKAA